MHVLLQYLYVCINTEIEEGVEHLANAVVICGQGQHLMQVFSQTLPPEVVSLLTMRIPIVRQVIFMCLLKSFVHLVSSLGRALDV